MNRATDEGSFTAGQVQDAFERRLGIRLLLTPAPPATALFDPPETLRPQTGSVTGELKFFVEPGHRPDEGVVTEDWGYGHPERGARAGQSILTVSARRGNVFLVWSSAAAKPIATVLRTWGSFCGVLADL